MKLCLLPIAYLASLGLAAADVVYTPLEGSLVTTKAVFAKEKAGITYCPSGDCSEGQHLSLTIADIREFDSTGALVQKTLLDLNTDSSVDWQPLVFTKVNDQDESVYTLIMANVLTQGQDPTKPATVKITASVYVADTTVTTNGQSVSVPAGAIKFSAKISNWPFETQDNTLLLEMTASGKSATVGDAPGQDISILSTDPAVNGAETQVVKFSHGFFMDASLVVNIDGKKDTVQVSIDQAKSTIGWKFPSFATFADYDPVLRFVAPRPVTLENGLPERAVKVSSATTRQ